MVSYLECRILWEKKQAHGLSELLMWSEKKQILDNSIKACMLLHRINIEVSRL